MFDLQLIALIAQTVIIGLLVYYVYNSYKKLKIHEREILNVKNELVRMQNIFESNNDLHFIHNSSDYETSVNGDDSETEQQQQHIIKRNKQLNNNSSHQDHSSNLLLSEEFSFPMNNMSNMLQSLNPIMNKVFMANIKQDDEDDDDEDKIKELDNSDDDNESNTSEDDDNSSYNSSDNSSEPSDNEEDKQNSPNNNNEKQKEQEENNEKQEEQEDNANKDSTSESQLTKCLTIIKNGKRAGQPCGKPVKVGESTCHQHIQH